MAAAGAAHECRNSVDITEVIPKQASVPFCRNCKRFLSAPQPWMLVRPEFLTEAHFIWMEPHSKRLRLLMTIQKEVLTNTILEQTFELEYLVQHGQCPDCVKLAAENTPSPGSDIKHPDVDQVLRLMECSKPSLEDEDNLDHGPDKSTLSQIFCLMKQLVGAGAPNCKKKQSHGKWLGRGPNRERGMDVDSESDDPEDEYGTEEVSLVDIRVRITTAGFTEAQAPRDLDILVRIANGSKILLC
ncbi:hypothetical protein DFH07DRAFT_964916 [Mycena maculata]|uniref:60S ribosomal export protein NMD3 n=1 Tax=Mycena maculata TaxID=230809 RepID=A0AAD7N1D8_9AGAR|nr:hypothetical protein DFH07DRAFT_964916 [Mycena maculata]